MAQQPTTALIVTIPGSCQTLGGISRTTLYELIERDELVRVNIGRRAFITRASLDAYVDRLSQGAS